MFSVMHAHQTGEVVTCDGQGRVTGLRVLCDGCYAFQGSQIVESILFKETFFVWGGARL